MANTIESKEKYDEIFDVKLRKNAFNAASDIRMFEIELYWKRAGYFWTLIGFSFAGFFALSRSDDTQNLHFLIIACIGFLISLGWYLANRGSKYWQENWEAHLMYLEDDFTGPLHKTNLSLEGEKFFSLWRRYRYSVSRINQIVSFYITIIWLLLLLNSFYYMLFNKDTIEYTVAFSSLVVFVTVIFAFILFVHGESGSGDKSRFKVRAIDS